MLSMLLCSVLQLLASVGLDDYHTLNVWDWRKGKLLSSTRGHSDRIFDVQFNPFIPNTLVTCGVKHIKFWSLCGNSLTGKKGIFGKAGLLVVWIWSIFTIWLTGELQSILCAAFAPEEVCYTGTLSGDIYKWKGRNLLSVIKRAHMVSNSIDVHLLLAYLTLYSQYMHTCEVIQTWLCLQGAVYSLHSCEDGFASGSKDGVVKLWDKEFKIITTLDIARSSVGYQGAVCTQ